MRIDDAVRWLIDGSHEAPSTAALIHGFASRLCAAGLDLVYVNTQTRPLSPQVAALMFRWARTDPTSPPLAHLVSLDRAVFEGGTVDVIARDHHWFDGDAYRQSPFRRVIDGGEPRVRCRLVPGQTEYEFPILADLHARAATDYVCFPIQLRAMRPSAFSLATRRPGGFTDDDLAALDAARHAFELAMAPLAHVYTTRALMGAYLGAKTGERVLSGHVVRGDVEEIEAAIWFSDLRGFTPMSAGVEPRALIGWLNEYFDAIGRAIARHDGEILKFIGDAVLAVWPGTERCPAALAAARDADRALDEVNAARAARGLAPLDHGIGLHVGAVQYGNIGAEGRLDFTVIGPSVNMASRLGGACARLGRRLVASAEFAARAPGLDPIGKVELKGIAGAVDVFGA